MCVAVCCPLLLIRVLCSVVFVITAYMTWNANKGSSTAYLLMTMLPEEAFIWVCTFTIWVVGAMEKGGQDGKDRGTQEGGDEEEGRMERV